MSPRMLPDSLNKYSAIMLISEEAIFTEMGYGDERYLRKGNRVINLPTQETWDRYRAAVRGFQALEAYEFTEWGGPDYGTEVPEPQPIRAIEWLETNDEWLARCRALRQETT